MTTPPASIRVTHGEVETIEVARALAQSLRPGDVVALHGELGAGKTRFVRGLAAGLGIDPALVTSPTFILVNEYPAGARAIPLVHVDAYRLSTDDDLETLDWERLTTPASHILVIEWAERIAPDALPDERFTITLHHAGAADTRRITIEPPPGRHADAGA